MTEPEFLSLGDAVWLDFVNTALGRSPDAPDRLPDAAAWARWQAAHRLRPDADGATFATARRVREELLALAHAMDAGEPQPGAAIETLNRLLAEAPGRRRLTRVGGQWRLEFAPDAPPSALLVIARSAAATLTDQLTFVRRCAGEGCSLYFADASATQSRRFCSAAACGHARFVERRRSMLA